LFDVGDDGGALQGVETRPVPLATVFAIALDAAAVASSVALATAAAHKRIDRGLALGIILGIAVAIVVAVLRSTPGTRPGESARLLVPEVVIIAFSLASLPLALALSAHRSPGKLTVALAGLVAIIIAARITLLSRRVEEFRRVQAGRVAELARLALHDPLTGLPNRTLLEDRLAMALAAQRRQGTTLAVLFCDLDRFKQINDTLGHVTGDAVLLTMAERLRQAVRSTDTVSRLGGDEFVILCPDLSGESELNEVVERVMGILGEPMTVGSLQLEMSGSVGVAAVAPDAPPVSLTQLLRDADAAMYRAKAEGRNRWARLVPGRVTEGERRRYARIRDTAPDPSWGLPLPPPASSAEGI
jgi:diguanylate cyclase (GGDEF)-like protein